MYYSICSIYSICSNLNILFVLSFNISEGGIDADVVRDIIFLFFSQEIETNRTIEEERSESKISRKEIKERLRWLRALSKSRQFHLTKV